MACESCEIKDLASPQPNVLLKILFLSLYGWYSQREREGSGLGCQHEGEAAGPWLQWEMFKNLNAHISYNTSLKQYAGENNENPANIL